MTTLEKCIRLINVNLMAECECNSINVTRLSIATSFAYVDFKLCLEDTEMLYFPSQTTRFRQIFISDWLQFSRGNVKNAFLSNAKNAKYVKSPTSQMNHCAEAVSKRPL